MLNKKHLLLLTCLQLLLSSLVTAQSTLPLLCLSGNGLYTTYYDTVDFDEPFVAQDNAIPNKPNTVLVANPNITVNTDWSVSYSGIYRPKNTGSYVFSLASDDGSRVSIDGVREVGEYYGHVFKYYNSSALILDAGEPYLFNTEFFQNKGKSGIRVAVNYNSGGLVDIPPTDYEPCVLAPPATQNFNCPGALQGLIGDYFASSGFINLNFSRVDSFDPFAFNYASHSPAKSLDKNDFSIKYRGYLSVPEDGFYRLMFLTDEWIRVKISNIVVIENGVDNNDRYKVSPVITLDAGKHYFLEIDYSESIGNAALQFSISKIGFDGITIPVPKTYLTACANAAIVSPQRISTTGLPYVFIPVTLRTQPTGSVLVFVGSSSNESLADPCFLLFTPSNWNVPQFVRARTTALHQSLTFYVDQTSDPDYNTTLVNSVTYILGVSVPCGEQVVYPGPTCIGWGEPHFFTFDGIRYDFYKSGDRYVVKTSESDFVVQSHQELCGDNVLSCDNIIAIRYQDAFIQVEVDSSTGKTTLTFPNQTGIVWTQVGNKYTFLFPNGIYVDIVVRYFSKHLFYYLNVDITLTTAYFGKAFGLCGTYDNDQTDEFVDPTGAITSFANFIDSWLVPNSENLFNDPNAIIPPLFPSNSTNNQDLCNMTACNLPIGNETAPPCPPFVCYLNETDIDDYCNSIFVESIYAQSCSEIGVNVTAFFEICKSEILLLCDLDAVRPLACEFQEACKDSSEPQCDCLCNLQGKCVENGVCECDDGCQGSNCEKELCRSPCADVTSPSSGLEGDFIYVTVYNLNHNGVLTCLFGDSVSTDAEYVDTNIVRCLVPPRPHRNYSNPDHSYEGGENDHYGDHQDNYDDCLVKVIILENGIGTNCGAYFEYLKLEEVCYDAELDTVCYHQEDDITTFCYNVSVTRCINCPDATFFIETDCGEQLLALNSNGNFVVKKWTNGWEFTLNLQGGNFGDHELLCFNVEGLPKLADSHGIFTTSSGQLAVLHYKLQAPECYPVECPTEEPPCEKIECASHPFGHFASHFNALVLGCFSSDGCEVEGRLAVEQDFSVSTYNIGREITPAHSCNQKSEHDYKNTLVVGGRASWTTSGKAYYGNIIFGSEFSFISDEVLEDLDDGCEAYKDCYFDEFIESKCYLKKLSYELSEMETTGSVSCIYGGLFLTASGNPNFEVFEIDGFELLNAHTFAWIGGKIASTATIIFNVGGDVCGLEHLSMDTFASVRNRIIWNFYECSSLILKEVCVEGTILAPCANVYCAEGVTNGQVFVKSWEGSMDIKWVPFAGCLPHIECDCEYPPSEAPSEAPAEVPSKR